MEFEIAVSDDERWALSLFWDEIMETSNQQQRVFKLSKTSW